MVAVVVHGVGCGHRGHDGVGEGGGGGGAGSSSGGYVVVVVVVVVVGGGGGGGDYGSANSDEITLLLSDSHKLYVIRLSPT